MVVSREVPTARVHDEAQRAELARRLLAGVGAVDHAQPAAPANGIGEKQHEVAAHWRRAARGGREVECLLERLHAAPQAVREDAVDLRERPVDRLRGARQPEPPRGERPERDDHGLVVSEHQRR